MRNLYWAAGVALLLFAALASWRGHPARRMAEPSPAAEERGTVTPQ